MGRTKNIWTNKEKNIIIENIIYWVRSWSGFLLLLLFIHFRQRNTIESCLLQKPKMWKKSFLCNKKNEFSLDVLSTCFHWRNHLQNNTQQLNYICSSSSFRQWTWGILGQFSIPNYDGRRVLFSISPTWPKNLSAILDTMWKASKKTNTLGLVTGWGVLSIDLHNVSNVIFLNFRPYY